MSPGNGLEKKSLWVSVLFETGRFWAGSERMSKLWMRTMVNLSVMSLLHSCKCCPQSCNLLNGCSVLSTPTTAVYLVQMCQSVHWKKYKASGLASIILHPLLNLSCFHSVWHCWLGIMVWPIKIEWWGWLKWGADCLHMGCHCQPQTLSSLASLKSRMVLPFRYRLTQVVLEKRSFCLLDPWGKGCCFFMPAIYATISVKSVVC